MQNTPASVVGKYQIVGLVGEGAMGNVYRAQDPVLNRTVAIKVMSDAIARDAALRERFMREAQAAGSLQHPNVVTVYDFGEIDGHLFIAMEFVDGVDLSDLIDKKEPLTVDDRIGIAIDVLLGLSYAHKRGVVHRDIKPANIRLTEEGHAKIMDFGVAHLDSAKMTATGMMVGTPNYMAPEQVTGQKIGPWTDLFAVGAVLYELLSYQKAFAGDSLHNVLFKVVSEDPPPLATLTPELPRGFDAVLRKAMAKDAEQRYQTAQEMANDLTAIRASLAPGSAASALSLGATIARQTAERKAASPNVGQARWTTGQLLAVSGVAAIALIAVTLMFARQRDDGGATDLTPTGVVTAPDPGVVQDSQTATPPVTPVPLVSEPVARRSETARDRAIPDESREAAVVSAVRVSAMKARAVASDAGVSDTQLAEGDTRVAEADRLARAKRYAEAVGALNLAMASWAQAERSRVTSGASTSTTRGGDSTAGRPNPTVNPTASNPPASPPVSSAPPVVAPSPVVSPPSPRPEPPARSATVEIASLVLDYARAIESRDLARIKALYPDITAAQQRGFQQFFERVRGLRAALTLSTPTVDGNNATAQVNGAYDYTDAAGKPQRQPVTFRAVFRNNGTRWLIASVR